MAFDDELKGVGGWLAFFLVTLGVITPGVSIFMTLRSFNDPQLAYLPEGLVQTLTTIDLATLAVAVALCWFATYRFLKLFNWTTVKIGIATLWALAFINVLAVPLLVSWSTGLPMGIVFESGGPQLIIRPLIYAGIWTAYLLKSVRVRNTYGQQLDEDTAEVFA